MTAERANVHACPRCGADTDPAEDFCGQCGLYLEWEERPEPPTPEPEAPPAEESHPRRGLADKVRTAIGIGEASPADGQAPPPDEVPDLPPLNAPGAEEEPPSEEAASALVVPVAAPTPGQPAAVKPAPPTPRPQPPRRRVEDVPLHHGDLVCGECGAGNAPTRKFCRRCGHDLVEAVVVRLPWWRRALSRQPRAAPAAGTRPTPRAVKRPGRSRRGVAALVVVVVLLGAAFVGRSHVRGAYEAVRDRLSDPTRVTPTRTTTVSSQTPGHPGRAARDGNLRTYWSPAAGDAKPSLDLSFKPPVRLVYVKVIAGVSTTDLDKFLQTGRPHEMTVTLFRSDGTSTRKTFSLEDEMGETDVRVATSDVGRVRLVVDSSFAGEVNERTAIAEVEFYRRP